jgi:hypothetical protein
MALLKKSQRKLLNSGNIVIFEEITMKKETKLLKKLELLLNQLNCREYLHHFGPKKYKLKEHLFALLLMQALSFHLEELKACLN